MKITAVYDDSGRILAGIIDDGKYDGPRPVADQRTHEGSFELPAAASKLSLEEICTTFKVDVRSRNLIKAS